MRLRASHGHNTRRPSHHRDRTSHSHNPRARLHTDSSAPARSTNIRRANGLGQHDRRLSTMSTLGILAGTASGVFALQKVYHKAARALELRRRERENDIPAEAKEIREKFGGVFDLPETLKKFQNDFTYEQVATLNDKYAAEIVNKGYYKLQDIQNLSPEEIARVNSKEALVLFRQGVKIDDIKDLSEEQMQVLTTGGVEEEGPIVGSDCLTWHHNILCKEFFERGATIDDLVACDSKQLLKMYRNFYTYFPNGDTTFRDAKAVYSIFAEDDLFAKKAFELSKNFGSKFSEWETAFELTRNFTCKQIEALNNTWAARIINRGDLELRDLQHFSSERIKDVTSEKAFTLLVHFRGYTDCRNILELNTGQIETLVMKREGRENEDNILFSDFTERGATFEQLKECRPEELQDMYNNFDTYFPDADTTFKQAKVTFDNSKNEVLVSVNNAMKALDDKLERVMAEVREGKDYEKCRNLIVIKGFNPNRGYKLSTFVNLANFDSDIIKALNSIEELGQPEKYGIEHNFRDRTEKYNLYLKEQDFCEKVHSRRYEDVSDSPNTNINQAVSKENNCRKRYTGK